MRYSKVKVLSSLIALAWTSIAAAQAPDIKSDLAANAALQYWQAFAHMPTLDKQQEKILAEWSTVPLDDPAVQKLVNASRTSLMYLYRGAKLPRCDWGLEYNDGIMMRLPHLSKARDLARLAALHGRYEFERGNKRALRDDATGIMVLGRQSRKDPILIGALVGYLIEGVAVDLTALYVPELNAPAEEAQAAYERLPPAATLEQAMLVEKEYMARWIISKLQAAEQEKQGSWRQLWKEFLVMSETPDPVKNVATVEEATRQLEDLLPVYDELAKMVALPVDEFDSRYPGFKQKTKAAHPLAGTLLPAVDKVLAKQRQHEARVAMLLAAIAVAQDGPNKLKDIKDPFGEGPFEYRAVDGGFELKSALVFEGKPVTLTVGQRKN